MTATLFRNGIEEVTSGPQVPRGEGNEFEHLSPAFEELQEYKLEVSGNGLFELRRSAAIDAHVFTDADLQSPKITVQVQQSTLKWLASTSEAPEVVAGKVLDALSGSSLPQIVQRKP